MITKRYRMTDISLKKSFTFNLKYSILSIVKAIFRRREEIPFDPPKLFEEPTGKPPQGGQ